MRKLFLLMLVAFLFQYVYAEIKIVNMKVSGLDSPIGIDENPVFSWQIESDVRGVKQKSYELKVLSNDGMLLWNSGTVYTSAQNNIIYKGDKLLSCSDYVWTVKVTDETGQMSEETKSTFGTAFMDECEWTAHWIKAERSINSLYKIEFDKPIVARWLKIDVTKLGIPVSTESDLYYLQLAEVEIYDQTENIALKSTVSSSHHYPVPDKWNISYINDGDVVGSNLGYTSNSFVDANQHLWIKFDLGETRQVDKIILYPRQDESSALSAEYAANFPASFTIQTSLDDSGYSIDYVADNITAPSYNNLSKNIPYYGHNFDIKKEVKRARAYVSALGVFTMKLNGRAVTENKLEPGESEYTKSVLYSTYDVTDLLVQGENTVIAQVAGGIFDITRLNGVGGLSPRYSKELINNGESCLKAELLIEYVDGTTDRIITDSDWKSTASPTTGSNWWGGEDYDARLEIEDINTSNVDLSKWDSVKIVSPYFTSSQSSGDVGILRSRMYEPLRIVEEWNAVSVNKIQSGGETFYVVDFGRNFAGQYRFTLKGDEGQQITLRTGALLNSDGSVKQEIFNTPPFDIYDSYIFKGDKNGETWGPEFMYHGTRYLQIKGLKEEPLPEDFKATRIRSNVSQVGSFETSNELINKIHIICRDAIQSQIYNTITDCPHREKLGWLDVPNEMYNSICYNYDMSAFWNKVVLDCYDAQYENGKVPSTVPHFWGDWDDDPNWGGSAIFLPYRVWKRYGNKMLMSKYYEGMKKLINYYTSLSSNYIMPGSSYSALSDWGQNSAGLANPTSAEFTITTTYYFLLNAVSEMAEELGYYIDAYYYSDLAGKVKNAFNEKFYNSESGVYEHGNHGEYGMPLYYGLVEEENENLVAKNLAESVKESNYKIKTGEIALKPVLMSLAKYGYNDVIYKYVNQTDYPSYGFFVVNGCTTTPEYWDMSYSQNHCMMDHIEEWFYSELGGIKDTKNAYSKILIQPWIPDDMNCMKTSVGSIYGTISSEYVRSDNAMTYRFCIPGNTDATIILPVNDGCKIFEKGKEVVSGENGINNISYKDSLVTLSVGSGTYEFVVGDEATGITKNYNTQNTDSGLVYNMSGQFVGDDLNCLPVGIYIQNGKKIRKNK